MLVIYRFTLYATRYTIMRQKKIIFQVFIVFLITSFLIFILSKTTPFQFMQQFIEKGTVPLQRTIYGMFSTAYESPSDELQRLREENRELLSKVHKQQLIEKDNQAFRDQFTTKNIKTTALLPAQIIGTNATLPGSQPTRFIIDKGEEQGVKAGMTVIYKNVLLGIILKTSQELSTISLITDERTSLTSRTAETNALGIIKGKRDSLLLDQVLLNEKLHENDTVYSRGDVKEDGTGYRPDLAIGKITAVQKKPSALFQTAQVKPLITYSSLRIVFIIVGK